MLHVVNLKKEHRLKDEKCCARHAHAFKGEINSIVFIFACADEGAVIKLNVGVIYNVVSRTPNRFRQVLKCCPTADQTRAGFNWGIRSRKHLIEEEQCSFFQQRPTRPAQRRVSPSTELRNNQKRDL